MKGPRTEKIRSLFDSIAKDYDRLNHILSLGVDRLWRKRALKWINDGNPEKKVLLHLYQRLRDEGYVIWIPEYRGERFSLLAEKGGKRFLILIALDSESEKKVWIAKDNSDSYTVVIIRDKAIDEKGVHSISLDMALSSFNFLSL